LASVVLDYFKPHDSKLFFIKKKSLSH